MKSANAPIKVLIVDDSALVRALLKEIINSQDDMTVVALAGDPYEARELIKQHDPDVLTLDIEMPRMNGLEFLERLMRLRPMPVVMISTLTEAGSEHTFRALELGAVDFFPKPQAGLSENLGAYAEEIADKIRAAALAKGRLRALAPAPATKPAAAPRPPATRIAPERLICIGASTGGTEAIREVLQALPPTMPGILIVQHMPAGFTRSFAERLNRLCALDIREAQGGETVQPGQVFIAPGDAHLRLRKQGHRYLTVLSDSEPVNRHRPAVDELFHSAAELAGAQAAGVLLTGMGKDGAAGLLAMRKAGAHTIAQNEASCVVYGMPREAVNRGAACEVLALDQIPGALQRWL